MRLGHPMEPCHSHRWQGPLHSRNNHDALQSHWFRQGGNDHKCLWTTKQPRQRPLSSEPSLPRFFSKRQVMDNKGWLQHDSHAGGETMGGKAPGLGQRKMPGTHIKPQTGRYWEFQWHLHLDQQNLRSPTNSMQAWLLPHIGNSPIGSSPSRFQHPPKGRFRPLVGSSLGWHYFHPQY